jgi:hypothetical protein
MSRRVPPPPSGQSICPELALPLLGKGHSYVVETRRQISEWPKDLLPQGDTIATLVIISRRRSGFAPELAGINHISAEQIIIDKYIRVANF